MAYEPSKVLSARSGSHGGYLGRAVSFNRGKGSHIGCAFRLDYRNEFGFWFQ